MGNLLEVLISEAAEVQKLREACTEWLRDPEDPSADERIVLFRGHPVGIIARRPGSILWFSTTRSVPFYSIRDASLSLVGDLWKAQEQGGLQAVRDRLAKAKKEAERLTAKVRDPEFEGVEA